MSGFVNSLNNSRGSWDFFLFVTITAWLLTIAVFIFFTAGGQEKFKLANCLLTVTIVYMVWSMLLLVAGSILAANISDYKSSGLCFSWKLAVGSVNCNHVVVAVVRDKC